MFLIALLFTTFGTALASQVNDMQSFPFIMNFLVMPLFFLSGAFFPLSGLSRGMALVTTLNPLSYGVDGLRTALGAESFYGLGLDFLVLSLCSALLLVAGSYLFSKIQI
jgi:ABC-2 type transport system permease protein